MAGRRLPLRVAAGVLAVLWTALGFGLIDLLSITGDPPWTADVAALDVSWGVLVTFVAAGAFAFVAWRPQAFLLPSAVQLACVTLCLLIGMVLGADASPLPLVVAVGVAALVLGWLARRSGAGAIHLAPHRVLLALAVVALPFWVAYALPAFDASRNAPDVGREVTLDVDHWPVHGATALVIGLIAVLAAVWPQGRPSLQPTTCFAAAVLAAASLAYPASDGAVRNPTWSLTALLWALTFGVIQAGPPVQTRHPRGSAHTAAQSTRGTRPA